MDGGGTEDCVLTEEGGAGVGVGSKEALMLSSLALASVFSVNVSSAMTVRLAGVAVAIWVSVILFH